MLWLLYSRKSRIRRARRACLDDNNSEEEREGMSEQTPERRLAVAVKKIQSDLANVSKRVITIGDSLRQLLEDRDPDAEFTQAPVPEDEKVKEDQSTDEE